MSANKPALWARVTGPVAVIDNGAQRFTLHRVSDPIGQIAVHRVSRRRHRVVTECVA